MKISRRSGVSPFLAMNVLSAANKAEANGESIIHMETGQPGSGAPKAARVALTKAMESSTLGYTEALGIRALRQRISKLYQDWYGIDVPSSRIVITSGASGGFILSFLAAFDVKMRVGIADPGYPSYRNTLRGLDIEPVRLEADASTRFQPSVDHIENAGNLDGLLVASPANPTGTVLPKDQMKALIRVCEEREITLVSDEIYHGLSYGERTHSMLEFTDNCIVVNSFSKYFGMTGWRIGWIVVPEHVVPVIERLAQNLFICSSHASQIAALAAMDAEDELDKNVEIYRTNRTIVLDALNKAGFKELAPCDGAFYVYANIENFSSNSNEFCQKMLSDIGVAAVPGHDFDEERGDHWIRFSFAGTTDDVTEAMKRITGWIEELEINHPS